MNDVVQDSPPTDSVPRRRVAWVPADVPPLRLHVPSADATLEVGVVPEPAVEQERLRKRLARRVSHWAGGLLVLYWLAAFTATHVPMPPGNGTGMFGIPHFDKLVHLGIYGGLAFLLTAWLAVRKRHATALKYAVVVGLALATYGAFDEISQGPFGRATDLFDWFADLTGLCLGLAAFFAVRAWVRCAAPTAG